MHTEATVLTAKDVGLSSSNRFLTWLQGKAEKTILGLLVLLCITFSLGISFVVFHDSIALSDEWSYLMQANIFSHGRLSVPSPIHREFFDHIHIVNGSICVPGSYMSNNSSSAPNTALPPCIHTCLVRWSLASVAGLSLVGHWLASESPLRYRAGSSRRTVSKHSVCMPVYGSSALPS